MKRLEWAVLLGFILAAAFAVIELPFSERCGEIRGDTLRLHIVANSDSASDQSVKLKVRDAVLAEVASLENARSFDSALLEVSALVPRLERAAERALQQNGFYYGAAAHITEMYFEERTYDGEYTLPAGEYTALRIELGSAKGQNWWCVMYPALCLPAADSDAADAYGDNADIVKNKRRYRLRFKTEELLQRLLNAGD